MAIRKTEYRFEELVSATEQWSEYLMCGGVRREYSDSPMVDAMDPSLRRPKKRERVS